MMEAPKPIHEKQRLDVLKKLRVLETPIEERFERITRIVCRSLNVPISAVSLVDEERQWFKSVQGINASETGRREAFCAHAILGTEPFVVEDALEDERFVDNPLVMNDPNIRFYAGVPIELEENVNIGTLCAIDQEPRSLSQDDIELLKDLANMVRAELTSIALSEAHVQLIDDLEEAERANLIDPLTRLWNRCGAEKLLAKEWGAAIENRQSLCLAKLDIDHLQAVNNKFGNDVGDDIIRCVSRTAIEHLKASDIVARWDGEEFLIILPNGNKDEFAEVMERIIADIAGNQLLVNGGILDVTVSVGGTVVTEPQATTAHEALAQADQQLQNAKQNGCNQFML